MVKRSILLVSLNQIAFTSSRGSSSSLSSCNVMSNQPSIVTFFFSSSISSSSSIVYVSMGLVLCCLLCFLAVLDLVTLPVPIHSISSYISMGLVFCCLLRFPAVLDLVTLLVPTYSTSSSISKLRLSSATFDITSFNISNPKKCIRAKSIVQV
uniref:Uncharacterized protein n=1 Tax=Panstrongylus lignarius TaxID=156445 RepID=A0A224Y0E2_9HEMI